jgi:methionine synthase I (cobalamin-dependent)
MRSVTLIALAALATAAMGCENRAVRQQEKAAEAQREANEKIVRAQNEAVTEITQAQVEANKDIAEANARFLKIREDYRHDAQERLTTLDKDIAKIEQKAAVATGKKKADYDAALTDVRAKRAHYLASFDSLQNSTAATWDNMKDVSDRAWRDLKDAVHKAPGITID